jgi:hypothetical protein
MQTIAAGCVDCGVIGGRAANADRIYHTPYGEHFAFCSGCVDERGLAGPFTNPCDFNIWWSSTFPALREWWTRHADKVSQISAPKACSRSVCAACILGRPSVDTGVASAKCSITSAIGVLNESDIVPVCGECKTYWDGSQGGLYRDVLVSAFEDKEGSLVYADYRR